MVISAISDSDAKQATRLAKLQRNHCQSFSCFGQRPAGYTVGLPWKEGKENCKLLANPDQLRCPTSQPSVSQIQHCDADDCPEQENLFVALSGTNL